MLATAPSWLSVIGLVCSIAVSVGVILTAVRKWFQRIVDDAVKAQTVEILAQFASQLETHTNDDATQFAKLHSAIEKGTP